MSEVPQKCNVVMLEALSLGNTCNRSISGIFFLNKNSGGIRKVSIVPKITGKL